MTPNQPYPTRNYPVRSYSVSQALFTLRSRAQLTQAALATAMGIHRRSIQKWESGETYPTAENLRTLITVLRARGSFTPGEEAAEVMALWQQVSQASPQQFPPFDPAWLAQELDRSQPKTQVAAHPVPYNKPRVDWGMAQDVPILYGRVEELGLLTQWVITEQCRLIALVGMGGIGKTSLAVTFARQFAPHFAAVIFRSLSEAPPLANLLDQLIQGVAAQQLIPPAAIADKLALLIELLRRERCLVILDNLETIMQADGEEAPYLVGYAAYGTLFKILGETSHQSAVLLTSREWPRDLAALEGQYAPVRSLRIAGLPEAACRTLLADQALIGTTGDASALARRYDGNPLALKLVAEPIRALFGGDIAAFLNEGTLFFDGVEQLLAQQIRRASPLEQALLIWLAIAREPIALDQLVGDLAGSARRTTVLVALQALWRRNLIERGQANLSFALQHVVLEYLTEYLISHAADEIAQGNFAYTRYHALSQATAKEYVRRNQEKLIVTPLLERLLRAYAGPGALERHLLSLLAALRQRPLAEQGYAPGNVIQLIRMMRGHLRGLDLSQLAIRQTYLQGVEMQDTTLADATLRDSLFTENFDALTAIAISWAGEYWATLSRRGEILVWQPSGGGSLTLHRIWPAHTALGWTLAFGTLPGADGNTLASGSWDGTVKAWDATTGYLRWVGRHTSQVNRVAFAPDGSLLASGGNDATVRLWDAQSGTPLQALPHPGAVAVIAWSPDGQMLISGDMVGALRLWTRQPSGLFACVHTLTEHTTWVDGLAFAPDGRTLASTSYDGTIKLWEISTTSIEAIQHEAEEIRIHLRKTLVTPDRMHRIVWSPDGRSLASCSFERTIWLWDIDQHSYRAPLQGHTAAVYDLAFTPDSHSLISGSQDGTLRVWEVATGHCTRVIESYTGSLFAIDWSPDGTQVVSVGTDGLVNIYAVADGKLCSTLRGHPNAVFGVSWSADGRWLASSELDNAIRLWETATGTCRQILQHPEDTANLFYGLAWSPDGQRLAAGTAGRGLFVWDVSTHRPSWVGQPLSTKIRHVVWSPQGTKVAGGGDNGIVYVWDATAGTLLHRLVGHNSMITSLAWSPDGTRLVSGGRSIDRSELCLWDPTRGVQLGSLAGDTETVAALAWGLESAPGVALLVSSSGGKLRWWNLESGQCVRVCEAHQGAVQALRRSPDGTKLASCGDDGAIQIWDLASGACLQTLRRDRPYERMNIRGLTGITAAQRNTLLALGAVER